MTGVLLAVAALVLVDPNPSTWGNEEVVAFVEAAKPSGPVDPFSAPTAPASEGQPFRLTFDLRQRQGYEGGSYTWDYDLASQRMKFSVLPESFIMTNWSNQAVFPPGRSVSLSPGGFNLKRVEAREDGGERSNAYGATVNVTTTRVTEVAVVELGEGYRAPAPFSDRSFLEAEVRVSPEEGRALSTDVQLAVEGVLRAVQGEAVLCGTSYYEPSIRNPRETIVNTCAAAVDVQRIILERKSTGEVIKAWPR